MANGLPGTRYCHFCSISIASIALYTNDGAWPLACRQCGANNDHVLPRHESTFITGCMTQPLYPWRMAGLDANPLDRETLVSYMHRRTDGRKDRQTERQADRQTDRQTDTQTVGQGENWTICILEVCALPGTKRRLAYGQTTASLKTKTCFSWCQIWEHRWNSFVNLHRHRKSGAHRTLWALVACGHGHGRPLWARARFRRGRGRS